MKKLSSILAIFLACVCMLLCGCTKLEMPASKVVTSNGGNTVQVGEYLYFANTFKEYSSLVDGDNVTGKTDRNSIYRVKLSDGNVELNDNGTAKNLEKVVSKIAGFESVNLFVGGDYIFFTTPNIHKTNKSQNRFDLVSLFKVKLNGDGLKEILTTTDATSSFTQMVIGQKDYLVVRDGEKIYKIEMFGSNNKTVLAEKVTGMAVDTVNNTNYLYYTSAREDSLTGNVLKRVNLQTGASNTLCNELGVTFSLVKAYDGTVFYTKTTSILDAYYYYNDFSNSFISEKELIIATSITDLTIIGKTINEGLVVSYIFEGNLYVKTLNDATYQDVQIDTNDECGAPTNILTAQNEYVYFVAANGIYRVDYKEGNLQKLSSHTTIKNKACDIVGNYFYYYANLSLEVAEGEEDNKEFYLMRASLAHSAQNIIRVECLSQLSSDEIEKIKDTITISE